MTGSIHIPTLAPEIIFKISDFGITNTMVNAWLAILIFLVLGIAIKTSARLRPNKLQNACEFFLDLLLGYFDQVTGDRKKTIKFLPVVGSIFFFILLSNWLGLLPGTGSITLGHNMLLRPANTDLNLTAAMALVSVIISHIYGFFAVGFFAHLGKFIQIKNIFLSVKKGPIAIFTAIVEFGVGLLEIISEIAKVLSLSLRLFGNIFAGEVLISVLSALVAVIIPTPFMLLELLVGLIQAAVFSMLTMVYLTVATSEPHGSEEH
ncbi:MAG: ATP synthase F0 subunit A [Candidatus Magasanikbacteria bacterium RIFCSPLOWO2_01_FULL_43_20b]|uniref:ATP synthase subunit a n=1 Tax=Candidatus Magasanikbacteria bacterium RIFCSPLOWO2_12_FULL_43_12 TaxID=1798692 RepID=A0A1F6MS14_9BACT|nr:MAG: ATP synthase F0 subunit A [Candidatus Magasanikbacteria bacterium RIFCSPLOWO2_02_FULL_43_22]OGH71644.1 MAG: ATP synthase F0 subunit A [Candidatus Magasanikbacteria bacterium RIFCSPHIGHO2_02_FULL_44_13]OGH73071.1 MAG: ATP synthase F0 subunit A [Candidatus Magasanikbacteria bacterium RIFCSPLOWO2_01_FULL_43_20b]OGH74431.1 MAG: ATP synthase F0 subunit A [Candidatus Magasanikbacteria bacterium RIFCSPLOWO2_12_FULL_43_12]